MFTRIFVLPLMLAVATPVWAAKSAYQGDPLGRLITTATAADEPAAARAIAALRARGLESLPPLLARLDEVSKRRAEIEASTADPALEAEEARLRSVVDRVAGQRYGHLSRLFWYTDFAAAQDAAAASGKPILSLRMLGNLTDEFSCANSRYFRTTLYVNQEIGRQLRENFVLHWQSVRPVPRVTIDFGDGRKLERTITGNSAHYLLAADGTPLDVLPGLYGPEKFSAWLSEARRLHAGFQSLPGNERAAKLAVYHAKRSVAIERQWARDFSAIEAASPVAAVQQNLPAVARRQVDRQIMLTSASTLTAEGLARATTEEHWAQMARLPEHRVELDVASRGVVMRENPDARRAGAIAVTKRAAESPLVALIANLQGSIAADTVRNEYMLHRQIHDWFAAGKVPSAVEELNDRVYAELFLTPNDDPWLGLSNPGTYTALENGGVVAGSR
jgi:hypothetical protein